MGKVLYTMLVAFENGGGALCVKLVDSKLTYIHSDLWQAFVVLAEHDAHARRRGLSGIAKSVHAEVVRQGIVRADELARSGFATSREITAACRELEKTILVHAKSVHTASGAHAKTLQSWSRWAADHRIEPQVSVRHATEHLRAAVARLTSATRRTPRVTLVGE